MRALWGGETVTHRGRIVVEEAKLYSRPERAPRLIGAAVTAETARWVGSWADGLITVAGRPVEKLQRVIDAFCQGGGEHEPVLAQIKLAWVRTKWRRDKMHSGSGARISSKGMRLGSFGRPRNSRTLRSTHGSMTLINQSEYRVISRSMPNGSANIIAAGLDEVSLHNVGTNQRAFIEAFGERVLPALRTA